MLAVLVVEREPFKWDDLPGQLASWVQDAGGFAAAGLAVWLLAYLIRRPPWVTRSQGMSFQSLLFVIAASGAGLAYALFFVLTLPEFFRGLSAPEGSAAAAVSPRVLTLRQLCMTYGGGCALAAVLIPFAFDAARLRWRRIWALAKLSFKEAIRRRVLWAFSGGLLVILFASWFITSKPEDQLRTYVRVVFFVMTVLLLITAGLLSAFSIPSDLKSQTIHTIVTKPVERFEIVLGRFLGNLALMTLVLFAMTAVSLVYVVRGVDEAAAAESLKARVPVFGNMMVNHPTNVGVIWEYRRYISGHSRRDWANWTFHELPASFATRPDDTVRCEFAFDIYRTTKGEENRGVYCSLVFVNWTNWDPNTPGQAMPITEEKLKAYREDLNDERARSPTASQAEINNRLAQKHGIYEVRSKEVFDFHTFNVDVPVGLFRDMDQWRRLKPGDRGPPLQVLVRCESPTQYLGVAKHDLYLLDSEGIFAVNFFKGAVGLWLLLCMVIGIAVSLSTYFSWVISALATLFLFIAGLLEDFIKEIATNKKIYGGGPMESLIRLATSEHPSTPLDKTPVNRAAFFADDVIRWGFRRLLNLIPDVGRYDLSEYVAQGFNIDVVGQNNPLVINALLLAGYLCLWVLLGYYLMKSREIAS